jgi:hypothetical protein
MIIAAIIIGIILLFFVFLTFYISNSEDGDFDSGITLGVIITLLVFMESGLISSIISDPHPTAMDVYQGKTTLEITYRDSIPVDTIVVLKPEFINK